MNENHKFKSELSHRNDENNYKINENGDNKININESCNTFVEKNVNRRKLQSIKFMKNPKPFVLERKPILFDIKYLDNKYEPILIENATFIDLLNFDSIAPDYLNCMYYKLNFRFNDGLRDEYYMKIKLADISSNKFIYPEYSSCQIQQVLSTHELLCILCKNKNNCSKSSKYPSNPKIIDNSTITKFNIFCNSTTCNGGEIHNKRDVQFYVKIFYENDLICVNKSNKFVVYFNNYSYIPYISSEKLIYTLKYFYMIKLPIINKVCPPVGRIEGQEIITIKGKNFFPGMKIFFGKRIAKITFISNMIIIACSPRSEVENSVQIKCVYKRIEISRSPGPYFKYLNEKRESLEINKENNTDYINNQNQCIRNNEESEEYKKNLDVMFETIKNQKILNENIININSSDNWLDKKLDKLYHKDLINSNIETESSGAEIFNINSLTRNFNTDPDDEIIRKPKNRRIF